VTASGCRLLTVGPLSILWIRLLLSLVTSAFRRKRLPRAIYIAGSLLALSAPAVAQPCPALQVRNSEGNYIIPGVKGDIRYSDNLSLDAYVQQGPARPPSIIVIHGGGWTSGSRIAHVGQILEFLTRAGYNWFSIDYRLNGLSRFEDSLADIRSAVAFIRCHARDLQIDASQLVLLGEDSGAHLAALLTGERLPGVIGAVLIGGFYDLNQIPSLTSDITRDVLTRASPMTQSASTTPVLVIHGEADNEAPTAQARRYCGRVMQSSTRCQFVEVAGASHRSENWWPTQWHYKQTIVEWLAKVSQPPALAHRPFAGVIQKDIPYRSSPKLALDAFVPRSAAPTPAVIVVHGGGWEAGDKVTYITPMLEPLARAGLGWFSIDYRLTPAFRHQDQLDDLRGAIKFVRAGHRRFNIDPARIFLLGESASGQMVAQVGTEDLALAGVVSFYGVYDFNAMVTDASPRSLLVRLFRRNVLDDESRAELRDYSPLYRAHKDMPPILLVNGTGERLWAQAQTFDRRLSELAVKHAVVALDGAPHGMENWEGHPDWMFYKQRVVEWIRRVAGQLP
jgi:acetyl esterase/lipase